jgi:hypothetical protein
VWYTFVHINTALAFAADAFIQFLRVKSHDMEMQLVTYRFIEPENWFSLLIGVHIPVFGFLSKKVGAITTDNKFILCTHCSAIKRKGRTTTFTFGKSVI